MLNLYAVTIWHSYAPRNSETIEVRTSSAERAEELAAESFPYCDAHAKLIDVGVRPSSPPAPSRSQANDNAPVAATGTDG